MPERFKNPPLVELAAELRWAPVGALPDPHGVGQVIMTSPGQYDEFFMRFSSKIGALGYDRIERIIPPGFPAPPFQTTYRFRKKDEPEHGTTIYQIGGGVFTANITPPYHSWKQFRPIVKQGVECLIETRNETDKQTLFAPVILRYINAFGHKFRETRSGARFIQEVLGFTVNFPESVRLEIAEGTEPKVFLQLSIPLRSERQMNIVLTEGVVAGDQALVMDLSVVSQAPTAANQRDVMASFDEAHETIHRVFVGMTEKLFHIMGPVTGEDQ